jgi:hypothetical protein
MIDLSQNRNKLFKAFLKAHPPRLNEALRFLDRDLFERLVSTYEEQWRDYYLPQLLEWEKNPKSKRDPALYRGDELQLFRPHHEIDYSNWLSWLLSENNPVAHLLQNAVLTAMCPDLENTDLPLFKVEREFGVRRGHDEHSGSLDFLLLNKERKMLFVIENKTRTPNDDELKKHRGYRASIEDKFHDYTNKHYILLVPDVESVNKEVNSKYGDFKLAEWSALSKSLRAIVMDRALADDVKNEVFTGLFVAAIEGYVLGYPLAAWRRLLNHDSSESRSDLAFLAKAIASSGYHYYLEDFYGKS